MLKGFTNNLYFIVYFCYPKLLFSGRKIASEDQFKKAQVAELVDLPAGRRAERLCTLFMQYRV
jgi:hypothetical protein